MRAGATLRLTIAATLLLSGCNRPADTAPKPVAPEPATPAPVPAKPATPAPAPTTRAPPKQEAPRLPPPEPAPPGSPGALPDDRTPLPEGRVTVDSREAAGQVVQRYFALLESHRPLAAAALWRDHRPDPALMAMIAQLHDMHALIGRPGEIDAGCGQRYITVPVQLYGRDARGVTINRRADLLLHRTDVESDTPEDRLWRIERVAEPPAPAPAP